MSATGETLSVRGQAILGRFPVHLDVERTGKQLTHVVESLGGPFDAFAGGYPVPPMPGQELLEPAPVPAVEQEPRNA